MAFEWVGDGMTGVLRGEICISDFGPGEVLVRSTELTR